MVNIEKFIQKLKQQNSPQSEFVKYMEQNTSPFLVLISCILSLRTKDETTYPATMRMLKLGRTPQDFLNVTEEELSQAIYPVGFYKTKAKQILTISKLLIENYQGKVPTTIEELVTFKGVGRKTANLTLAKGYQIPAICVDVHVHRICNRWGYVDTQTPEETEQALRQKLPQKYWLEFNTLLVTHGQNICKPINPKCLDCPLQKECNHTQQKKVS